MPEDNDEEIQAFVVDESGVHGYSSHIAMHRAAYDKAQMHAQEMRSAVNKMIRNLDADDAWTLFRMMSSLGDENAVRVAAYWAGQVAAVMDVKHDTCSHCGQRNHDIGSKIDQEFGTYDGPTYQPPA